MEGIKIIKVDGVEVVKEDIKDVRVGLSKTSNHYFGKMIDDMRENVMMVLVGMFERLKWEDIEEIYGDGCMVLWNKMNDKGFELKENSIRSYMIMICRNIGMHYLRGLRDNAVSLDEMFEDRGEEVKEDSNECCMSDMFDVMDESKGYDEDERYKMLDDVWERLSDIDRMILESYYWDGCRMEEIAKRIGYKSSDSVKSKKSKVLRKMMKMMNEGKAADSLPFPVYMTYMYNVQLSATISLN